MVDEAWRLAIEAQDCQRILAGASVCTPPVFQLPSSQSLKIDLQTQEAISVLLFKFVLFYWTYNID